MIKADTILDLLVSVDKSGLVLIHELTSLHFFRAFNIGVTFELKDIKKLKLLIHQMGYFIFLDHEQTISIYKWETLSASYRWLCYKKRTSIKSLQKIFVFWTQLIAHLEDFNLDHYTSRNLNGKSIFHVICLVIYTHIISINIQAFFNCSSLTLKILVSYFSLTADY